MQHFRAPDADAFLLRIMIAIKNAKMDNFMLYLIFELDELIQSLRKFRKRPALCETRHQNIPRELNGRILFESSV